MKGFSLVPMFPSTSAVCWRTITESQQKTAQQMNESTKLCLIFTCPVGPECIHSELNNAMTGSQETEQ